MTDPIRTMLAFDIGADRFQVRAAAIIRREGHILIHRATRDPFWALPGGRVEMNEDGATTLVREIEEEMGCTAVAGPLCFVLENFFRLYGRGAHELGLYFEATLTGPFPFDTEEVCHRSIDGDAELEFRWVRPEPAVLEGYDFKPAPLRSMLAMPRASVLHLVHHERETG